MVLVSFSPSGVPFRTQSRKYDSYKTPCLACPLWALSAEAHGCSEHHHAPRIFLLSLLTKCRPAGFSSRFSFVDFVSRYSCLCQKPSPVMTSSPKTTAEAVIREMGIEVGLNVQIGASKVFLRKGLTPIPLQQPAFMPSPKISFRPVRICQDGYRAMIEQMQSRTGIRVARILLERACAQFPLMDQHKHPRKRPPLVRKTSSKATAEAVSREIQCRIGFNVQFRA